MFEGADLCDVLFTEACGRQCREWRDCLSHICGGRIRLDKPGGSGWFEKQVVPDPQHHHQPQGVRICMMLRRYMMPRLQV
jgi:hypothetical protein